jgi:hypothetical protein
MLFWFSQRGAPMTARPGFSGGRRLWGLLGLIFSYFYFQGQTPVRLTYICVGFF